MDPTLIFEDDGLTPLHLSSGGYTIGRGAKCDHTIDHKSVSRRHARVYRHGDRWYLEDLGSTNGTSVNGNDCKEPTALEPGDEILIGEARALFLDRAAPPPEPEPLPGAVAHATHSPSMANSRGDPLAETVGAGPSSPARRAPRTRKTRKAARQTARDAGDAAAAAAASRSDVAVNQVATRRAPRRQHGGWANLLVFMLLLGLLGAGGWGFHVQRQKAEELVRLVREGNPAGSPPNTTDTAVDPGPTDAQTRPEARRSLLGLDPRAFQEEPRAVSDRISAGPAFDTPPAVVETSAPVSDTARDTRRIPWPRPHDTDDEETGEEDPLQDALRARDAGAIARELEVPLDETSAAAARQQLEDATIYHLQFDGALPPEGLSALRRSIGFTCLDADVGAVEELQLSRPLVLLTIRVRHEQNYKQGLGPLVGNRRIAPHPKQVSLEITTPRPKGTARRLLRLQVSTPADLQRDLEPDGLTEAETWQRTFATIAQKVERALREMPGRP